jgi:hypothetical protein
MLGLVPAEGPWGQHYRQLAAQGHAYYRQAHFFTRGDLAALFAAVGMASIRTRSALFWSPAATPDGGRAREGDDPAAGFTALCLAPRA